MSFGLDAKNSLILTWRWRPEPPLPLTSPLPDVCYEAPDHLQELRASLGANQQILEDERRAFNFSFPQLARQTPDLLFYRLTQIFNTPLASVTTREAGRVNHAYWRGKHQVSRDEGRFAHFWFFRDETEDDLVVLEFAFNGAVRLYSQKKSLPELARRYMVIMAKVEASFDRMGEPGKRREASVVEA